MTCNVYIALGSVGIASVGSIFRPMTDVRRPTHMPMVLPNSTTFCPSWPRSRVIAASRLAEAQALSGASRLLEARVEGHTTPAVADIGAASLRLRFGGTAQPDDAAPPKDGGYLLGIRLPEHGHRFLPAVAGIPGRQGLDRFGCSRVGLAECCVVARPVTDGTATFVPDAVLREWAPVGSIVEVIVLARVTDFFLGLNAGTWLRIRIQEIMSKGEMWLPSQQDAAQIGQASSLVLGERNMLEDTGLEATAEVGPGIEDSNEAFQFWGGSGNAGVSGQVILLPEGMQQLPSQVAELVQPSASL